MPFLQRSKLLLLAGTALGVLVVVTKKDRLRELASFLCELLSIEPDIESDLSRDAFAATEVDQVVPTPGHTHANAAALRTSATNFVSNMAQYCGSEVYVVGMSKSDQRKDMKGSRQWYWAKDVISDNRRDVSYEDDIRYLCDVDYYVDMPELLSGEQKPVLLYTVVPEEACSSGEDDTSFCFNNDGMLVTNVAGGGTYVHPLWDYGADSFLVVSRIFGIPYRATAYAVERKQVSKHRQVILLAPMRMFNGVLNSLLALALLEQKELARFNPMVRATDGSKFVRFQIQKKEGMYTTTARPNTHLCATIPAALDDSVATVSRLGSTHLMLPTTASWVKDNRPAAAVLTEYYRLSLPRPAPMVYPVSQGVRAYQFNPNEYDQDAKPKLQAFMSPLIHEAFAPVPNKAGEEQCVRGRVTNLKKDEPKPSRFRDRCIDEFANLIVQDVYLEPVCVETVASRQTSATQKLSLYKAFLAGEFRAAVLKCFIKAEAYLKCSDPRNISTYNDGDKLDMATFALAMAEHCKQFKWYGPGKTPVEVAERVAEICSNADYVNVSDYHRMDGTISYTLRRVERAVLMKAFGNHRAKLNELLKTNVDNKSYLPHGTTFDQGSSHGSGCSATSLFQTLRAAFTAYLAFRHKTKPGGVPYTPGEAFKALGIHLGDDGLDAGLPESAHSWAAAKVGLVLEAQLVQRGHRGVNFLARYYSPEVWTGSADSMCDASRQLSKLHTTVRLPAGVTPEQKLVEKAMSYVATDGNTPVVGEFCKRVLVLSDYRPKSFLGVGSWWAKFDGSVQFPNENVGGWMDVEFEHSLPEFDRRLFNEWMDSTGKIEDMLSAPLCCLPKPPALTSVKVVVDEDVVEACEPPAPSTASSESDRAKRPRRKPRNPTTNGTFKSVAGKSRK